VISTEPAHRSPGISPDQSVRMVASTSVLGQKVDVSVIAVLQLAGRNPDQPPGRPGRLRRGRHPAAAGGADRAAQHVHRARRPGCAAVLGHPDLAAGGGQRAAHLRCGARSGDQPGVSSASAGTRAGPAGSSARSKASKSGSLSYPGRRVLAADPTPRSRPVPCRQLPVSGPLSADGLRWLQVTLAPSPPVRPGLHPTPRLRRTCHAHITRARPDAARRSTRRPTGRPVRRRTDRAGHARRAANPRRSAVAAQAVVFALGAFVGPRYAPYPALYRRRSRLGWPRCAGHRG